MDRFRHRCVFVVETKKAVYSGLIAQPSYIARMFTVSFLYFKDVECNFLELISH
jgi:hypothetical protein